MPSGQRGFVQLDEEPETGDVEERDDGHASPPPPVVTAPPTMPLAAVVCYMVATFIAFMDSNLLAPNLTAIAHSFNFSPDERDWKLGGELAFGYFVIAAPMALVAGSLADSGSRRWLFAAVLVLGKLPCLLTYFVHSYRQLFILRTLMGVTIGAVTPLVSSMAGDMFPVQTRTAATAIWSSCSGLGTLAGQYIAGILGPNYGWRLPFLVVAIPGLITAFLVLLLPDPIRGRHEEALKSRFEGQQASDEQFTYQQTLTAAKVFAIFSIPSNVLGFLQGVPGCIPWGVLYAYINDFLAQDKGMTIQDATKLMVVFGIFNGIGGLVGGLLGQRIYNHWKPGMPLLMGATTAIGIIPTLFLINYSFDLEHPLAMYTVAAVAGFLVTITGGNIRTVFLNVNPPEIRGTVFGIFCITDDVGKGLGPFFAASLIAWLGRLTAFNVCIWMWAACGLLLGSIGFFLEKDEKRLQAQLAVYIEMETIGEENVTTHCLEALGSPRSDGEEGDAADLIRETPLTSE